MIPELETGDWEECFSAVPSGVGILGTTEIKGFTREDVAEVIARWEEANDHGTEWSGVCAVRLADGRFAAVSGWCDYTGWGCQDGRDAKVASTLDELIEMGLTQDERDKLALPRPSTSEKQAVDPRPSQEGSGKP